MGSDDKTRRNILPKEEENLILTIDIEKKKISIVCCIEPGGPAMALAPQRHIGLISLVPYYLSQECLLPQWIWTSNILNIKIL